MPPDIIPYCVRLNVQTPRIEDFASTRNIKLFDLLVAVGKKSGHQDLLRNRLRLDGPQCYPLPVQPCLLVITGRSTKTEAGVGDEEEVLADESKYLFAIEPSSPGNFLVNSKGGGLKKDDQPTVVDGGDVLIRVFQPLARRQPN